MLGAREKVASDFELICVFLRTLEFTPPTTQSLALGELAEKVTLSDIRDDVPYF